MNIYDISQKAGVSIATVSRVLNGKAHVSEKTRNKVLSVIEQTQYVPNPFARGLGLNTMKTIGLACPDASDPYLGTAIEVLEREFHRHEYECILVCTGRERDNRIAGISELVSRHVDGVVLIGSSFIEETEKKNQYIRDAAKNAPVFLLNGSYTAENVYSVFCDDLQATKDAVCFLHENGRRRILYLYHTRNDHGFINFSGRQKKMGYLAGLEKCGLPMDPELIRVVPYQEMDVLSVQNMLMNLHDQGLVFDAVMTSEDILAVGAVKFARKCSIQVPDELSIIGYNNSQLCLCCDPELSSIDNQLKAIGECIVESMINVLAGKEAPRSMVFNGKLIQRSSTGLTT